MTITDRSLRDAVPVRATARDTGIDLIRALCVTAVVLLHAIMVGVTVGSDGPVFTNAAEGASWFAPLTWLFQVMPLFFVIGGFAGATAYERLRARGGTAIDFVTARVHRLLLPAVFAVAAAGALLALLTASGVPADLVGIAGFRFSQPLWFLGVFLACQALLPALLSAHRSAPLRTMGALVAAAVLVDVLRAASGRDGIGFVNLLFVWLTLQQLGFFLADGQIDALTRRTRGRIALAAVGVLVGAFATGVFSPDLIEQLNPPTTALLLVGAAHTFGLSLIRGPITRLSTHPRVAAFTDFVTARTMTIYLWHMPVLLGMAGVTAVAAIHTGAALPAPSSPEWWLTRPVWLVLALLLTGGIAALVARPEQQRMGPATTSTRRTVHAVLLGLTAVVLLLLTGTTVIAAIAAGVLLCLALASIRPSRTVAAIA